MFGYILKGKAFWITFIVLEIIYGAGSYYYNRKEAQHNQAVQMSAMMERNEYCGQAKLSENLDSGHYTVIAVLDKNLALVRLNLPTGDMPLLVCGLSSDVLRKRYFSKVNGKIET